MTSLPTTKPEEQVTKPRLKITLKPKRNEAKELLRKAPMSYVWNQIASFWLFGSSFIFTILLTHGLSPSDYGNLGSALTIYNTGVYIAAFGLEDATTVFVPRIYSEHGKAAAAVIVRRTLITRLIMLALVSAGMLAGVPLLAHELQILHIPGTENLQNITLVPGLNALAAPVVFYIIGTGFMNVFAAVYTSIMRTRLTFLVGSLSQLGVIAATFAAIRMFHDIGMILWAIGGVTFVTALVYFLLMLPLLLTKPDPKEAPQKFTPVLQMGWTAWLTNLINGALLKQVAIGLLQAFLFSSVVVGYFNLAFQLSHAAAYLLVAGLGGVGMAAMAASYAEKDIAALAFAWRAVSKVQVLLAVPLLGFCFIYAQQIAVVLYGAQYANVGYLMQIFLLFNIIQRLGGGGSNQAALFVVGKQRLSLWTQWIGLLMTIGLGIWIVPNGGPNFGGAAGALIAVGAGQVFSEITQLILSAYYLKRIYPIRFSVKVLLALTPPMLITYFLRPSRYLKLAISAGFIHIPGSLLEIIAAILIFTLVLIVCLAIVKPIEMDDITMLSQVNPKLHPVLSPFASGKAYIEEQPAAK